MLPLIISVTNEELDDQSLKSLTAALGQALRDRNKQREKTSNCVPGEKADHKVIGLNRNSPVQLNEDYHKRGDDGKTSDHSKRRSQLDAVAPSQTLCDDSPIPERAKQGNHVVETNSSTGQMDFVTLEARQTQGTVSGGYDEFSHDDPFCIGNGFNTPGDLRQSSSSGRIQYHSPQFSSTITKVTPNTASSVKRTLDSTMPYDIEERQGKNPRVN